MPKFPFDKIAFVLSVAALSWLYGFTTMYRGWFPTEFLRRAWSESQIINPLRPPAYLHGRRHDREGVRSPLPDRVQPGLTIITSAWTQSDGLMPGLRLIGRDGTVLHEWRVDPAEIFAEAPRFRNIKDLDIHGSYLFPNGDVLVNLEYAGTLRLDACGRVLWRLESGNHHSIARADDGTLWIPAVTKKRLGSPDHPDGFPGIKRPVYQDQLMRVSEDGGVLDTINLLDLLYANGLEWYLAKANQLNNDDPTHLNDIEPLPDSLAAEYPLFEGGDLVVSLRHLDMVFVVDPISKRVKWYSTDSHIHQHDPDFIGNGWIAIFDNREDGTGRGTMLGGSRVIAFQPHTDSLRILFPTSRSEPLYTAHRGKWQLLENGNLLLTEEWAGRVVEVAQDGRTVWEWIVEPVQHFDRMMIPAVTKATRINLSRDDVAAWPCAPGTPDDTKGET